MKALLKSALFGTGRSGRHIPFGLYSGLTLSLDPSCEMGFGWEPRGRDHSVAAPGPMLHGVWSMSARVTGNSQSGGGSRGGACSPIPPSGAGVPRESALNGLTGILDWRLSSGLGADDSGAAEQLFAALPEPILVKIDVDGGEEAILQRMRGVLAAKRMLLLVETHSRELDAACHNLLAAAGYDVRRIVPAWWRGLLREQRPLGFNQWLVAEARR